VQARVAGQVVVRAVIGPTGDVIKAEVVSGHPVLKTVSIDAARKWKFNKVSTDNRTVLIKFDFVILSEKTNSEGDTTFLPPDKIEISKRPLPPSVNYSQDRK
jgi:hypothetical protein